jgi:hypothetical protein
MRRLLFDNLAASAPVVRGGAGYARRAFHDAAIAVFGYDREGFCVVGEPPIPSRSEQASQVPCLEGFASAAASAAREPRPH